MRKPIFAVLSILFFLFSCTKIETTDIANGLIPPIDGVNVKDTFFDVITNTFIEGDTSRIYKSDEHVIGSITNDPLFGKTNASLLLELKPTVYPFSFTGRKDSIIVDSAVLVLSYKGVYGDSTIPQTWKVMELNDELVYSRAYPADTKFTYGQQLGSRLLDIRGFNDSIKNKLENAQNQIRIELDKSFATRLIKNYDSLDAYKNDSIFKTRLRGLAIVPETSVGNALIRVSLLDTNTKLSLYYSTRLEGATRRDTTVSYFRFNTVGGSLTSGSANSILRERAGSEMQASINSNKNDSLVYVQTSPGSFVTIRVPNLSKFRNVLVHRAELAMYQAPHNPFFDGLFSAPRYMLLSAYDSVNKRKINIPNDYEVTQGGPNAQIFGGFRTDKLLPGSGLTVSSYTFALTRYVQGIVTRRDSSYVMHLSAPSNDSLFYKPPYPVISTATPAYLSPGNANIIAIGRVRLFGGSGLPQQRMRLRVIYSEL